MNARHALPLLALLSLHAAAQEGASIGVQARVSKAEAGLKDVTGSSLPGLGLSLVAELGYPDGYRARLDLGYDQWQTGDLGNRPGVEGSVSAFHVGIEGLMMLNGDEPVGPYVLAGIGGYGWDVKDKDKTTGITTKRRGTHAAGTLGIGYRITSFLDAELKVLAGKITPDLSAAAVQFGITYRFKPSL
jgi:hypothetical protein